MTRGEQAARFERLLATELAAIGRVAASYESDPSRRQDLLQEISIALWRALPAFRGESSERTFALRIAHHRAVTYSMRRPPAGRSLDDAMEVPAPEPGPEADAVASQRRARLHRAIRELPLAMRQVLTLALEGLSNREVGEVLGISDNAVAIRLTRARQALRDRLQPASREMEEACVASGPRAGRGEVACK